jgi:hypothetical protein
VSLILPTDSRGPILDLELPESEAAVELVVRNKTTGKTLTINLPAEYEGGDLRLDWYRRTVRDQDEVDRSAWLDPNDLELWTATAPIVAGVNDLAIEANLVQPQFISPVNNPARLTTDATYIYWGAVNQVGRAKLDGSSVTQLLKNPTVGDPGGIAVDGTYVYYAQVSAGAIGRAKLDGSSPNAGFLTAPVEPLGVAVDATYIYWADKFFNAIGRAKLDASGPNTGFIAGGGLPSDVAVDATYIYWADAGAIGRAKLDGSSPNKKFITAGLGSPTGVAVDATYIYWADAGAIGRAKLDGSSVEPSFLRSPTFSEDVAIRSGVIYWADAATDAIGRWGLKQAYGAVANFGWEKGYY